MYGIPIGSSKHLFILNALHKASVKLKIYMSKILKINGLENLYKWTKQLTVHRILHSDVEKGKHVFSLI
jgi:hypothetical protein